MAGVPLTQVQTRRQRLLDLLPEHDWSVSKAVETLVGLLDGSVGWLKRLAARDILDQHAKFRELDDLTTRIERIEERLEQRQ